VHYYFIGIGGIGMSGLAKILLEKNHKVSGSDPVLNTQTAELTKLGAKIFSEQDGSHIKSDIDTFVVTSAIKDDNPELIKAKSLNIKIMTRSELLNEIITQNHKAIAVTGTHGKTTTSSMITHVFSLLGEDPTAVIGAEVKTIKGNSISGKGEYAIAEVCEYQRAFLDIYPFAAVITNIEEDHLDCYKDLNDIIETFKKFVNQIDEEGYLVYLGTDKNSSQVAECYPGKKISYGLDSTEWTARNLRTKGLEQDFDIYHHDKYIGKGRLGIPGSHNVLNALAAFIIATEAGLDIEKTLDALATFRGADRRFQLKGTKNDVIVIDDYAHHPTEITATLKGARDFYPKKRLVVAFQPHQHSRTKFLRDDFVSSLKLADIIVMSEIYAVRDTKDDIMSISSNDLVNDLTKSGKEAYFTKDLDEALNKISEILLPNDIFITIGAGPIYRVGESYLKQS
jgi:UDP-N-acetylmuramate--alanine ligase